MLKEIKTNKKSKMEIREINKEELDNILLRIEDYDDFWTREMYLSEYNNPYSKIYVLDDLSGLFVIQEGLDETFLMNIVVDKSKRNQGLGRLLLQKVLEVAKSNRILLEVDENNEIAVKLYKAFGFKEISRRKNYYKTKTAIIMEYLK